MDPIINEIEIKTLHEEIASLVKIGYKQYLLTAIQNKFNTTPEEINPEDPVLENPTPEIPEIEITDSKKYTIIALSKTKILTLMRARKDAIIILPNDTTDLILTQADIDKINAVTDLVVNQKKVMGADFCFFALSNSYDELLLDYKEVHADTLNEDYLARYISCKEELGAY